jgi:hypothetical protein
VSRPAPPGGVAPPATAELPGADPIELAPLAEEASRRYFDEFPDDLDRYGPVARDWCVHDNRYILAWAIGDLAGHAMLARQVDWLASLLGARDYPLDRLARNLEIAAAVLGERLPEQRDAIDAMFATAAESVRSGPRDSA